MTKKEMLEQLSKEKKGILRTADAQVLGISRPYFLEFIQKHGYEKMAHGIYLSPDAWEDGMYILQSRCPHVVFSHESALYLLGLTDREPMQHTVTVKSGYKTTNLKEEGVIVHIVKKERYPIGITEIETPMGNMVRTYNAERSICDILRRRSQVEIQDRQTALKEYARSRKKDIPLLLEYAEEFKVDKILMIYLEMLL